MEGENDLVERNNKNLFTFDESSDKKKYLIYGTQPFNEILNSEKYQNIPNMNTSLSKNLLNSYNEKQFNFSNCKIISSIFSKENIIKCYESNKKKIHQNTYTNNTHNHNSLNLQRINDIKQSSIFELQIFGNYIKYYPIFNNITDNERWVCYSHFIESNSNLAIENHEYIHFNIKDYFVSVEKLEILKEKYIKHLFTKRNITMAEEIFKYLFEEIKLNLSCVTKQSNLNDILLNCSNLIQNINDIVEIIINDDNKNDIYLDNKNNQIIKINDNNDKNYCKFNNGIVKKSFVLNDINSKFLDNLYFKTT